MRFLHRIALPRLQRWSGLLIPLALFGTLALYQLSLPGLHYDEAREAGVNAMQLLRGLPVDAFRGAAVHVAGQTFPLMVQDYIGALNVYLAIPFLAAGGVNSVVALRLLPVLTAAVTLALAYRLAERLAGGFAASVTALLLAVSPSFVFWSRQGIFVTNITALLAVAAALLALHVARRGRLIDWAALGVVCGLGLWAKLLFVWVLGAGLAVAAGWVLGRRWAAGRGGAGGGARRRRARRSLGPAVCVGGLLAGTAPLLLFNLQTGGTFIAIFSNLGRSYYGVNNADFLHNLGRRIAQLGTLLRGDHFWYLGAAIPNRLAPWLLAMLLGLALGAWLARPSARRSAPLPWLAASTAFVALYVAQSSFTVSDLFVTHYATLLPFLLLTAGLAAGVLARAGGRIGAALAIALVLVWAGGDLAVDVRYHRALAQTGGHSAHSDAVYTLADYLAQRPGAPVVALDWGMDAPVRFLTAGQVNPVELFGYDRLDAPDPGFSERLKPFLARPETLYLLHAPSDIVFQGRREVLEALAAEAGRRVVQERVILERTQRPLFLVVRVTAPQ